MQSISVLISHYGANAVLFSTIKNQKLPNNGAATNLLVWRQYSVLGSSVSHDIPKHVLITSAALAKNGSLRTKHFALVCKSRVPIKMGGPVFRFSNAHYKNLGRAENLGSLQEGNELRRH